VSIKGGSFVASPSACHSGARAERNGGRRSVILSDVRVACDGLVSLHLIALPARVSPATTTSAKFCIPAVADRADAGERAAGLVHDRDDDNSDDSAHTDAPLTTVVRLLMPREGLDALISETIKTPYLSL
jgi:hypothetical protein